MKYAHFNLFPYKDDITPLTASGQNSFDVWPPKHHQLLWQLWRGRCVDDRDGVCWWRVRESEEYKGERKGRREEWSEWGRGRERGGSQPANLVCTCRKSWQSPFPFYVYFHFPPSPYTYSTLERHLKQRANPVSEQQTKPVSEQQAKPMSEQEILHMFSQMVDALKYLHDHNVLHRSDSGHVTGHITPHDYTIACKSHDHTVGWLSCDSHMTTL